MKNEMALSLSPFGGAVSAQTIDSQALLQMVNDARKSYGEKPIRNNDFVARIKDELEGETYEIFVGHKNGADIEVIDMQLKQALRVAARESKAVRRSLVDKLEDMQAPAPVDAMSLLSDPATLRGLLLNFSELNIQLGNQLAIAAPKAEFYDRYADASGTFGFRQVCKALGEKEHLVRSVLVEKGIMNRLGGQLTPYQNHIDAGRFTVKTGEADNGHAFTQARFTTKGVTYLAGLIAEYKLSAA